MGRKAVSEAATKWQIIGMKDGSMISNREIARLKISEDCIRNTLKTLKTTGCIQHHAESRCKKV